jgi:peptide/nickel transport system substrate-binding protein
MSGCRLLARHPPLVVVFGEANRSLDPHFRNSAVGWSLLSSFYDSLVAFSPRLQLEPALAESWTLEGGTRWRFRLRPDVRFHNGVGLTAEDVVASLERARTHASSALRYHLVGVTSVRAEDSRTVVIETASPVPDLLNRLTFVMVIPASLATQVALEKPVGTGPYRFAGLTADGALLAKAWGGWHGRPEIDDVRFEFVESDEAAVRRLVAGRADVCHLLPDDWVSDVAATKGLRVVEQPRLAVTLLAIHPELATGEPARALADPRVRRAMLLALDRPSWIRKVFRGNGLVATQFVHPAVFGFEPELAAVPCDPEEARRLLAGAGFPHGFEAPFGFRPSNADLAEAIARDLAAVGVRLQLRPGVKGMPLDCFSWACSTGDASDFLNSMIWHTEGFPPGAPATAHGDAETIALLRAADSENDRARRLVLLQQAQRRVLDSLPLLPLTIRLGHKGVSDRVEVVTRYDERDVVASFRWRR